jgi:hypothetical protein
MKVIENVSAVHHKVDLDGLCLEQFGRVRDVFRHQLDTAQDVSVP